MPKTRLKRFDRFKATFQPRDLATLKPDAGAHIGERGEWEAAWLIEDDDSERFAGQWACTGPLAEPYVWVPEEDLVDIEMPA